MNTCRMATMHALGLLFLAGMFLGAQASVNSNAYDPQELPENFNIQDHMLQYPARPLPERSCACRVDISKNVVLTSHCPTPWDHPAKYSKVAPQLDIVNGALTDVRTGKPAELHGLNWFGWETSTPGFDGLWAYNDNELAPNTSIKASDARRLGFNFWEKRTMTNDFATVVHRMKSLGFNAVRVPFNFTNLARDIPKPKSDGTEFYACMRDPIAFINQQRTLDPALASLPASLLAAAAPKYTGMAHPPPARAVDPAQCRLPWEAPFLANYTPSAQYGKTLQLTMCNWYLPQGENIQAVHRFLWQVQYLVSQGFYVAITHTSYLTRDPNMVDPNMLASNWGNLWRMISELPGYDKYLKGRVFPDLVNEPSRWGCQWERDCSDNTGTQTCAPGAELYHRAIMAIHNWDPDVPVFANAMGQSEIDPNRFPTCSKPFRGMSYGDGTITNGDIIRESGISDASRLFQHMPAASMGKLVLSPHVYPGTLTGLGEDSQRAEQLFRRLDLSFGLKMLGQDFTSDQLPLDRVAAVLGEFGVKDHGTDEVADANGDSTNIADVDAKFLSDLAVYMQQIKAKSGNPVNWFFWSWNANSQDTKGIVGPNSTWKHVQFTKVRLLSQLFQLRPWYCSLPQAQSVCEGSPSNALLTPEGRSMAVAFGRRLVRKLMSSSSSTSSNTSQQQ